MDQKNKLGDVFEEKPFVEPELTEIPRTGKILF